MAEQIKVKVKLFAIFQEVIGQEEICLDLASSSKVSDALDVLLQQYPDLEKWRSHLRYGVNLEFVPAEHLLCAGDELVFIPPVSGG
jgi:sulfur-carrier protein